MLSFLRGDADCLVATTIIESGLDIPQANTLIVERADQLGLAQAYQIRGRVGRSRERAFAYLLYPSEEALSARGRASAWRRSPTTPSSAPGFAIAMRDLELRGAGDLLGDEQSGHVAAVGFELYVALLDEAVEALRAAGERRRAAEAPVRLDVDVDAYLPADYIPFEAAKIDVHRRIAGAREPGELRALRDELRDRFGPVPEPVENLLALQRARIELGARRRAHGRGPRRAALGHPARARRGDRRAAARADPRGDLRAARARRCRCASPTSPAARLGGDARARRGADRGARRAGGRLRTEPQVAAVMLPTS